MSKRKKSKKRRTPPRVQARFAVGDAVRVKRGVRDEDFPDIPLGGWAGTVREVNRRAICTVRWSPETLKNVHPIYRKRCAIQGLDCEKYWIPQDELEPDPGGPLSIEQPTEITPRPLSAADEGDRVRMVFGLTSDDFLPRVSHKSLEVYYDYLKERLSFPFEARYEEIEDFLRVRTHVVTVTELDSDLEWDEEEGILCEVRTAAGEDTMPLKDLTPRRSSGANYQLVQDYTAWFAGELQEDDEYFDDDEDFADNDDREEDEDPDEEEVAAGRMPTLLGVLWGVAEVFVFSACYGAMVGSAVLAMPWAKWGAGIGAGLWGLALAITERGWADRELAIIPPRLRKAIGVATGLVVGTIQGAFLGIAVVAFLGALGGLIAALMVRSLLGSQKRPRFSPLPGILFYGPAAGIAAQAYYVRSSEAVVGLWNGAMVGVAGGLSCFVLLLLSILAIKPTAPVQ